MQPVISASQGCSTQPHGYKWQLTSGSYSRQRAKQWQVHLQLTFPLLGIKFVDCSLEVFSGQCKACSFVCVQRGLGAAGTGQCTAGSGSLICPGLFSQGTVGEAGAEGTLSLGKRVGKFATKPHVLSSSCGVGH